MGDAVELNIESLVTGYGGRKVLSGVSLRVRKGEIVALIGHNGAGKSTLLKAVFRLLDIWEGDIQFQGKSLAPMAPERLRSAGIAYVPQGNRVFQSLSVLDNLQLSARLLPSKSRSAAGIERALTALPGLRELLKRRAGSLSGGEKQMLALASALTMSPRLLLLDEPSLGLAPSLVTSALRQIERIGREAGASVLIVEQRVRQVLMIADFVYVLRAGGIHYSGTAKSLADEARLAEVYL